MLPGASISGVDVNLSIGTCDTVPIYSKGFVQRSTDNYAYDANGNLTRDPNKKVNITYNHLNLPEAVEWYEDGVSKAMEWLYDADGTKLQKLVRRGSDTLYVRDYFGEIEYQDSLPHRIYHQEGYAELDSISWNYFYFIRDQLGTPRVTFTNENDLPKLISSFTPYPFGGRIDELSLNIETNDRLFNGKEWENDFGLGLLDFGNRWQDPWLPRFTTIDRFAQKYAFQSPYSYAAGNPVKFIDVNGDSIAIRINKENIAIYQDGKLYNQDGSDYTGKGVKVKKDGSIKLKGFLKATVSALDKIRTGGDQGNTLISNLQSDKHYIVIGQGKSNRTAGFRVSWNPTGTFGGIDEKGNTSRPSYIGLAHELAHTLDWADDARIDIGTWITYSDGRISTNSEKYASHIENQIRAENNIPLRAYYGIDNGKGVGRLLIPGTRYSQHYDVLKPYGEHNYYYNPFEY